MLKNTMRIAINSVCASATIAKGVLTARQMQDCKSQFLTGWPAFGVTRKRMQGGTASARQSLTIVIGGKL